MPLSRHYTWALALVLGLSLCTLPWALAADKAQSAAKPQQGGVLRVALAGDPPRDRKSTRLNSSHT